MELKDLLGKHVLSGCQDGKIETKKEWECDCASTMDFILDGKTISVVEDPDNGYRSSLGEILENREGLVITNTFPPVDVIGIAKGNDDDIVDFYDCITGKVILSVGTADTDDYYPYFVAKFTPENMCHNMKV